jgi:hypothetical protein
MQIPGLIKSVGEIQAMKFLTRNPVLGVIAAALGAGGVWLFRRQKAHAAPKRAHRRSPKPGPGRRGHLHTVRANHA